MLVLVVRRAEDWVRSLFARPWHTTPAMQMLEASDFLRAPWETVVDHPRILGPGFTDDLIGQFIGQDLARRLSRRLGEGLFNGALTARVGGPWYSPSCVGL